MSTLKVDSIVFENYDVSMETGFLMESPLEELPEYFEAWNRLSKEMPDLVEKKMMKEEVLKMPYLDASKLKSRKEIRLAYLQLSIIGAGYVWEDGDAGAPESIPECVAVPWYEVSSKLGVQPILSHPGFCLVNYKQLDPDRPLSLNNMKSLYIVPGGDECDWFVVVTCAIELEFTHALQPILSLLKGGESGNIDMMISGLQKINKVVKNLQNVLSKMHDNLTADTFYNKIRPFLSGWGGESNPLPGGLIYEGVEDYEPLTMIGGSAAQSAILQLLDVTLGIEHSQDKKDFLEKMRKYMLPIHHKLIKDIDSLPFNIRTVVEESNDDKLREEYNSCLTAVSDFRSYHIQIVTKYVIVSANKKNRNKEFESLAKKGTGGTSLLPFLKDLRKDTKDAVL
ncbi:myoglobin [Patella vulgata]|uniref:myoglobin n=1 Tax=Patella vulgata TaxID=6465 RepID=UPI00217F3783|nr:myoglobin [Patella vulgata]